ncbi:cellulase family glycosylhydrolase [Labilibaculum sp. K2S]|uniref:cellulase family glycosylhydrolase n=1 Tax=Labilibaculum sp. K2S TaxID=3056386 RepID=UPI0025A3EDFC|nr:cellulase family glycosylhydrolase [Labilibaculum sp. K2S]MDM8159975.1 cellulase family glycosylhydrolase [Labilibaculum sp. K2S]
MYNRLFVFLVAIISFAACDKSDTKDPVLTVSAKEIVIEAEGGEATLTVDCNDTWSANNSASWLQLSQSSGAINTAAIVLSTEVNNTGLTRSTILVINSTNGQSRRVTVSQASMIFQTYNISPKAPDATGMESTATEIIANIKVGINIGNTFELTTWAQADPSEAFIDLIKASGFNAVRIPGGFGQRADQETAKIDVEYMARVKKVVQWCVNRDMYVLLNIHWDGGWLEQNCTIQKQDSVNAKQKAYWEQIATEMRDFDEHLMFASANEPSVENAEENDVLMSYHQSFINAVRSTGGRNTYRTLVIQGHTDLSTPDKFPTDPTADRIVYEWHNYTPSSFTLLYDDKADGGWDNVRFYWGEGNHYTESTGIDRNCGYGEEAELLEGYQHIKTAYIDQGIPCLMGEFSSQRFNESSKFVPENMEKYNQSVDDWYTFNTRECKAIGGAPFVWDTGGLLDREGTGVRDQRTLDAIMAGLNAN